ncbi:hypothetical protein ABW20_dc0107410 [Dactylellina cionopaga]|nr:hypothetical protein ABW20_dc0107410 [Dactylellina cionopaga]
MVSASSGWDAGGGLNPTNHRYPTTESSRGAYISSTPSSSRLRSTTAAPQLDIFIPETNFSESFEPTIIPLNPIEDPNNAEDSPSTIMLPIFSESPPSQFSDSVFEYLDAHTEHGVESHLPIDIDTESAKASTSAIADKSQSRVNIIFREAPSACQHEEEDAIGELVGVGPSTPTGANTPQGLPEIGTEKTTQASESNTDQSLDVNPPVEAAGPPAPSNLKDHQRH